MSKWSTLVLSIAIAALSPASMTFAQTVELFGPVLPMTYDGQGGRHYCRYGYEGPLDPPIHGGSDGNTTICRSGPSPTPRPQDWQFGLAGALARAEATK